MNIDKALVRSKQAVNILWSLFLLVLFIYIAYFVYNKNKKKKYDKNKKKIVNTTRKELKKEESSMMKYPSYDLDESTPALKIGEPIINDLESYNYADLLRVVETNDSKFFEEYTKAILQSLQYKIKKYTKLLDTKLKDTPNLDNILNKPTTVGNNVSIVLEEIIELINNQITIINSDIVYNNFKKMLWHKENGLETLIERNEVKNFIACQIFAFKKQQKLFFTSHQNGLILGGSGIGKSKLGKCLAYAFSMSGIMAKNEYVCVSADRIRSPYVDDTARVCREFFELHLEKLVLLEEIYSLTPNKTMFGDENRGHGQQAIDVIVDLTEVYKGLCRIYGIGYADKTIEQFIEPNEGMARRFPRIIKLEPFTNKGLAEILIRFLSTNAELHLSDKEASLVYAMIIKAKTINENIFDKEAGSMENLSSDIAETIYETKAGNWIAGNFNNNSKMLLNGFNKYLYKSAKVTITLD